MTDGPDPSPGPGASVPSLPAGEVVDARGLPCPLPVLRLAAVARHAVDGALLTLVWTDPAAAHDVPAWARMRGHVIVASTPVSPRGPGRTTVRVARPGGPPA